MILYTVLKLYLISIVLSFSTISYSKELVTYSNSRYGNDSQFNPIAYYLNASFDTIQNPYYFNQKNYFANHGLVYKRIRNPGKSIEQNGGWKKFFEDEFLSSRAMPNYSLHLIGGGYDYRKLVEWFNKNNYPYPYALAFLTSYAAEFANIKYGIKFSNR